MGFDGRGKMGSVPRGIEPNCYQLYGFPPGLRPWPRWGGFRVALALRRVAPGSRPRPHYASRARVYSDCPGRCLGHSANKIRRKKSFFPCEERKGFIANAGSEQDHARAQRQRGSCSAVYRPLYSYNSYSSYQCVIIYIITFPVLRPTYYVI